MFAPEFRRIAARSLALLVCGILVAATSVQARPKSQYTLGLGGASNKVSGDFNGQAIYNPDSAPTLNVYGADLEDGSGVAFLGGVHLNDHVGFEGLYIVTSHEATSQAPLLAGLPLKASVGSLIAALRLMAPMGNHFELFARAGLGVGVVLIDRDTDNLQRGTFTGGLTATGLGFALFFDQIGVEFGVLNQKVKLDTVDAEGTSGKFQGATLNLRTAMLILTAHFGK